MVTSLKKKTLTWVTPFQDSLWQRWCQTHGQWRIACTCHRGCPTAWRWRHRLLTQRSCSRGLETNSSRPLCGQWKWWPADLSLCPTMHCKKGGSGKVWVISFFAFIDRDSWRATGNREREEMTCNHHEPVPLSTWYAALLGELSYYEDTDRKYAAQE